MLRCRSAPRFDVSRALHCTCCMTREVTSLAGVANRARHRGVGRDRTTERGVAHDTGAARVVYGPGLGITFIYMCMNICDIYRWRTCSSSEKKKRCRWSMS
jgi:hypothetical protein